MMLDGAKPHDVEHPTSLPDLEAPESWPDESERNLRDANDPENWPGAGDPNEADDEEAERAANAATVLRAAADALVGKRPVPSKEPKWDWRRDDEVLTIREQPLTG